MFVKRLIRFAIKALFGLIRVFYKPPEPDRLITSKGGVNDYIEDIDSFPAEYWGEKLKYMGFTPKNQFILDLGCGCGQWSRIFAQNNCVIGLDLEPVFLKNAHSRKSNNESYLIGTANYLPFGNSIFDSIFSYGVFNYVDFPRAIGEVKRVLKNNGVFILAVQGPAYASFRMKIGLKCLNPYWFYFGANIYFQHLLSKILPLQPKHLMWDSSKLQRILQKNGFIVDNILPERMYPFFPEKVGRKELYYIVSMRKNGD